MCLDFHDYPRNENRGEKVEINKYSDAADDRQSAADKARPTSIEFSTSFAHSSIRNFRFKNKHHSSNRNSLSKNKHKQLAI